ncbi:MAG: hydrogenase iron-sulfur subunit [Candidatus Njordarchaeota archaeon]
MNEEWEPRIIAFLCKYCASAGADLAGVSRLKYPPNVIPITVPCSGRVDMQFVMKAFKEGADGVFIGGCHTPNDCHFLRGNFKALKRVALMKKMLEQLGINPDRLRLEWISATEGAKFARVMTEFVEQIKKLGPLRRR